MIARGLGRWCESSLVGHDRVQGEADSLLLARGFQRGANSPWSWGDGGQHEGSPSRDPAGVTDAGKPAEGCLPPPER